MFSRNVRLTFTGLRGVIFLKTELFITTAVRALNTTVEAGFGSVD
jgi:hypothetical protein